MRKQILSIPAVVIFVFMVMINENKVTTISIAENPKFCSSPIFWAVEKQLSMDWFKQIKDQNFVLILLLGFRTSMGRQTVLNKRYNF